jgi:uncharacterized membrane protein YdjX (TVP38/TMEM64 family)
MKTSNWVHSSRFFKKIKSLRADQKKRWRNRIILWGTIIGVCLIIGLVFHQFDLKTIHSWGARMNGWILFALMALLPLVGIPISILCVMAGAKFGPWEGLGVTSLAVAFNLAASWWIVRSWLRKPLEKLLRKTQYKKPTLEKGEYAGLCLLTALIPGPSYTLKNYFLAMSNLPFRIIFWIGLPAHVFAMSPGILFGNFSGHMTGGKLTLLIVYTLLLIGASQFLIRRLRNRKRKRH